LKHYAVISSDAEATNHFRKFGLASDEFFWKSGRDEFTIMVAEVIANSLQKVASPLIWWKRGSSRRRGGFALSLLLHVGRAAMPHIAMVPITAIMRTIN
jgi:hypothetical protein